jgi:hypothetical protein
MSHHTKLRADAFHWTVTKTHGIDTVTVAVKGVTREPTPGYVLKLTQVDVSGGDPATLLLVLTVTPPTGIEPQHVVTATVEYQQTFVLPRPVPSKVTIFEAAATVDISAS